MADNIVDKLKGRVIQAATFKDGALVLDFEDGSRCMACACPRFDGAPYLGLVFEPRKANTDIVAMIRDRGEQLKVAMIQKYIDVLELRHELDMANAILYTDIRGLCMLFPMVVPSTIQIEVNMDRKRNADGSPLIVQFDCIERDGRITTQTFSFRFELELPS
jgi:hypothetical protein